MLVSGLCASKEHMCLIVVLLEGMFQENNKEAPLMGSLGPKGRKCLCSRLPERGCLEQRMPGSLELSWGEAGPDWPGREASSAETHQPTVQHTLDTTNKANSDAYFVAWMMWMLSGIRLVCLLWLELPPLTVKLGLLFSNWHEQNFLWGLNAVERGKAFCGICMKSRHFI